MRAVFPDLDVYPEIAEFNREFIRLMLDPAAPDTESLFGMPQQSLQALRETDFPIYGRLEEVPCLLVELAPLLSSSADSPMGCHDLRRQQNGAISEEVSAVWQCDVKVFAAGLLTYIWSVVRRDTAAARLFLGLRQESITSLAAMSFGEIRNLVEHAPRKLLARFTTDPRFWPDLVRVANSADSETNTVARLAALPLLVARTLG
ncbi:MAG: hypothetical protein ACI80M_000613 [Gammaproteobacteria bacterium]|jgi:hypothetical protein